MNFSMKLFLLTLTVIFLSTTVSAQTNYQKQKAQEEATKIATALELDDEMKQKIYDSYLNAYVKVKEVRNEGLDKVEEKKKTKAVWKESATEIKSALGPEKAKEFQKYRKEMREKKKKSKG